MWASILALLARCSRRVWSLRLLADHGRQSGDCEAFEAFTIVLVDLLYLFITHSCIALTPAQVGGSEPADLGVDTRREARSAQPLSRLSD